MNTTGYAHSSGIGDVTISLGSGFGGMDADGNWVWQQPYYDFNTGTMPKVGDKFWIYTQFGIVKAKVHTVQEAGTVLVKIKLPERERANGIKWVAYDKPLRPDECFSTKYEIVDDVISRLL